MADKKFTLIGKELTREEAAKFPEGARFTKEQAAAWAKQKPEDLLQDEVFHHLDRLSLLMISSVKVQCPVGPHDDPGLDIVVLRACNISKVGSVAVECSQGHWAEYPCG
jgi:hypothetical protein